jgi:hypothetical protein
MTLECEYCNKTFSTKSNLKYHMKTAKYCLEIQKRINNLDDIQSKSFDCIYCKKEFSTNQRLLKHSSICIERYKKLLETKDKEYEEKLELKDKELCEVYSRVQEIKDRIIELEAENRLLREHSNNNQSTINEIAKQPRVATTNNKILITTPVDLSQSTVQQVIKDGFSDEYMIQGQKGIARFAYDNMLKDNQGNLKYICTDPSRQIFQYKTEEGKMQKDVKAKKLTKALLDGDLKSASHKIASDKMAKKTEDFLDYSMYYLEIKEMEDDNSNFSKELSTLVV